MANAIILFFWLPTFIYNTFMSKLIYGKKQVFKAISDQAIVEKIYFVEKPNFAFNKIIKMSKVTNERLTTLVQSDNHDGIAAKVHEFRYFGLEEMLSEDISKVIILDHIKKNQNLGAIIRSANAFGITHVIIPDVKGIALVTYETVKIASGGLHNIKVVKTPSIELTIMALKEKGIHIYVTALNEKAKRLGSFKPTDKFALVVGNEANGVSPTTIALSDDVVYINMFGSVQSLNVSVALGISLFELTKNKNTG